VQHERSKEVLFAAAQLPRDERVAYVDRILCNDEVLRAEVHSLLDWIGDPVGGDVRADPNLDELEERRVASRYQLLALLGEGSGGVVFLAHDELLDVPVSIKRARRKGSDAFAALLREASIARRVRSPHVCAIHEILAWRGDLYFVMDYMEGRDLSTRLDAEGALPPAEVGVLAREIASGLGSLHDAGVVHGDVKPENVLVDRAGVACLTDFGVARAASGDAAAGPVAGTRRYLSPERRAGAPSSMSDDVYALALLLRDLLLGRPDACDPVELRPPDLEALIEGIEPALAHAISLGLRSRRERPAHAGAFLRLLGDGAPKSASRASPALVRPITALWCEFRAGSDTPLAELAKQRAVAERIAKAHGGYLHATWHASALLALFGVFGASNRQEARAIRAALAIHGGSGEAGASAVAPSIAIETHALEVAVDDAGNPLVDWGDGVLRGLARRASSPRVVVSQSVRESLGELFEFRALDDASGFDVAGERRARSIHVALRSTGVRVAGREREQDAMRRCWEEVRRTRRGAVLAVVGPPGIGKTRLIGELGLALRDTTQWIETSCPDLYAGPFAPWREVLAAILGRAYYTEREFIDHLLGEDAQTPSRSVLQRLLIDALVNELASVGRSEPAVLVVEDLHWCDPASLEVLIAIAARAVEKPILIIASWRSECEPLDAASISERLELGPIDATAAEQLILDLVGPDTPPSKTLLARAAGIPLYIEQLARAARGGAAAETIPASLQALLRGRIDGLGPDAEVARAASVIGREFDLAMLAEVSGRPGDDVESAVEHLIEAGLVEPAASAAPASFRFGHALLHESAYASIPASERRSIHDACRRAILARGVRSSADARLALAQHCEGAGREEEAIAWWTEAGQQAAAVSAHASAIQYFARALALHPDAPRELEIRLAMLQAQQLTLAFGYEETRDNANRALALIDHDSNGAVSTPLLALARTHIARADRDLVRIGQQIDPLAERSPDGWLRAAWFVHCGTRELLLGNFRGARGWLLRGVEGLQRWHGDGAAQIEPPSPLVFGLVSLAFVESMRCSPDAHAPAEQVLMRARAEDDRAGLCYALVHLAQTRIASGEPDAAYPLLAEADGLARRERLDAYRDMAALLRACTDAHTGDPRSAAAAVRAAMAARGRTRWAVLDGLALSCLALAEQRAGDDSAALGEIERGLELAETRLDAFWAPELRRQRAVQLARLGAPALEVVAEFERAIRLAQQQEALVLELRARTSLAAWHPEPADRERAFEDLAALVARPGLDPRSVDLRRARSALEAG
jgi:tetratricopeptide (TPR) repeat protein